MRTKQDERKKLHWTSLDMVIYVTIVFTAGITVGFAVGRYKQARFYFASKRLDTLLQETRNITRDTEIVRKNVTDFYIPAVNFLKQRAPEFGCVEPVDKIPLKRKYSSPDTLMSISGIQINLADSTNSRWQS